MRLVKYWNRLSREVVWDFGQPGIVSLSCISGFHDKVLVGGVGGCRSGLRENSPETTLSQIGVSISCLPEGTATVQSWASEQWWLWLWGKGKKLLQNSSWDTGVKKMRVKQSCRQGTIHSPCCRGAGEESGYEWAAKTRSCGLSITAWKVSLPSTLNSWQ